MTSEKDGHQLGKSRREIDDAEHRDSAAHKVVPDDGVNERYRFGKIVPIPERGPGHHEQRNPELEKERDDEQSFHDRWLSACWARDRYMMRVGTSRYPSASASNSIRIASARADSPWA